jgi:hypothetical protein
VARGVASTVFVMVAPASAQSPPIAVSPDVTAIFGGLEVRDQGAFVDGPSGFLASVDLGPLPEAAAVDALHTTSDAGVLFSLDSHADLGGLPVAPADVVRWGGTAHEIVFDASVAGVPPGTNVDALSQRDDELLLSFDADLELGGIAYRPVDLVAWDGVDFSLAFDGLAAGLGPGLDVDAAHLESIGDLLLSFDTAGSVGGVDFADEDVLRHDPSAGSWEMFYDGSAEHPEWLAADLDAVSVHQAPLLSEVPTLSDIALLLLTATLAAAGVALVGVKSR